MFKGILLLYNQMFQELYSLLNEDAIMAIAINQFKEYCVSPDNHADFETGLAAKHQT
jgi:hypothetical protein